MHAYLGLNRIKNVSKRLFGGKIKNCNQEKAHNPFIYAGLHAYLPQHCLYLRPLPHGCQCLAFLPLSHCSFPYITVYFSLVLFSYYRLSLLKMVLKVVLKHHFFHIFYSLLQLNYIIITLIYLSNLTYF